MPERNFEQQARDMVNGFEMKPKPEVWQNVRNAIQEPQRKRRFVLWWWLLPFGLLGGSVAFYILNNTAKEKQESSKTIPVHQSIIDKKTTHAEPQNVRQIDASKKNRKENSATTALVPQNSSSSHKQSEVIKTFEDFTDKKEKTISRALDENTAEANKTKELSDTPGDELNQNIITPAPTVDNNKHVNEGSSAPQSQSNLFSKDSLSRIFSNKDSIPSAAAININPVGTNKSDSLHINKQKKQTKWHWGILAEGGIADRRSSVFSLSGNMEKSSNNPIPSTNSNGLGSTIVGLNQSNGIYYNNTIKQGGAFGLGVTSEKRLTKSLDFSANAVYYYQSFHLTTATYKDSLVLNNSFTTFTGSYDATQIFHFASLYAGINWHFINTKHLQFGVSAGLDNLLLVTARQKINGVNSSNYTLSDAERISNIVSKTDNFYKYQPSLFTGVLMNIKGNNKQLQLVPFVRNSFRPLDKNTTSTNNHLFSAGLRVVYLFE